MKYRYIIFFFQLFLVLQLKSQTKLDGVKLDGVGVNFNNKTIGGMVFWVKPEGPFTLDTTSGTTTVSTWFDVSTIGTNNLVQSTKANQALYTNISLSSFPCLMFDGVNDRMDDNSLAAYVTGSDVPYSFYFVAVTTNLSNTKVCTNFANSGNNTPVIIDLPTATLPRHRLTRTDDASTTVTVQSTVSATNALNLCGTVFKGTTVDTYVGRASTLGAALDVGTITLDSFSIGESAKAAHANPWDGEIYEIMMFNKAVSDNEHKVIMNYFLNKYGQ